MRTHTTRFAIACLLTLTIALSSHAADSDIGPNDWPWWRGPDTNGIASPDQSPPSSWGSSNAIWKVAIPGRGHGSPTVVGDHVYLATADHDRNVQSIHCFDRNSGKTLWVSDVHKGGIMSGNKKASQASSTVACDGERIYANFVNGGAVYTTALDRSGKKLWQTKISKYKIHQGYGSSPAIYKSLVLVSADNKLGGAIAALNQQTGKIVWRVNRPKKPNYPSPVVVNAAGREQLIMTGCDVVSSFNPLTGKKLWEVEGATTECVTTTVTNGDLVYTSGGYPKNHVAAMKADGSGEIVWWNSTRVYVPSMVCHNGYLYAVSDAGAAICWDAATGKEQWKNRLGRGFTASPVMVGDRFYAISERGETFVYSANPKSFKLISQGQLGNQAYATPTICGGRIYQRVAVMTDSGRQEMLYCIGE